MFNYYLNVYKLDFGYDLLSRYSYIYNHHVTGLTF